jgi:hypothetical protein
MFILIFKHHFKHVFEHAYSRDQKLIFKFFNPRHSCVLIITDFTSLVFFTFWVQNAKSIEFWMKFYEEKRSFEQK